MWYIRYEVIFTNENEVKEAESGIVYAENYADAAQKLENFYGIDLVEITLLRYIYDEALILPKEVLDAIEQEVENYNG